MPALFGLIAFASFVCIFVGLIKPSLFNRLSKKPMTRKRALGMFSSAFAGSLILAALFSPPVPPSANQIANSVPTETDTLTNTDDGNGSDVAKTHPSDTSSNSASSTVKTVTDNTESQADTAKTVEPEPKAAATSFGNGTFVVGTDIQPGTYRTRTASSGCYYVRLSGFSGSFGEIIANANTNAPAIITISASDKGFESTRCGTWTNDLSAITSSQTSFGDGMYIVGTDIQPGTYRNSDSEGCYYVRLRGFTGSFGDILSNKNTNASAIVTIASSDKGFAATRCGVWTKME